jgi:aspartate aminotransferase
MNNAGWPEVREKVADYLTRTQGAGLSKPFGSDQVVMTVGAAGAMNAVLRAVLDEGSEVIALAPYFMEYNFYAANHGGHITVSQTDSLFRPDPEDLKTKISSTTRAVIINSPNNPTGVIYTAEELSRLGAVLREGSERIGRPILLISDEPYRKLAFNDQELPSIFSAYPWSVLATSFSKDLSLAGERIGYLALNPDLPGGDELLGAVILANRILGFVNAPSLMQKAAAELLDCTSDLGIYRTRQQSLVKALRSMGYSLVQPEGTFYIFPQSPLADDLAFINLLREELILAVPGSGFGRAGHFRLSLCLPQTMIDASLPGFERALARARERG